MSYFPQKWWRIISYAFADTHVDTQFKENTGFFFDENVDVKNIFCALETNKNPLSVVQQTETFGKVITCGVYTRCMISKSISGAFVQLEAAACAQQFAERYCPSLFCAFIGLLGWIGL